MADEELENMQCKYRSVFRKAVRISKGVSPVVDLGT